jgi:hypothetical protein
MLCQLPHSRVKVASIHSKAAGSTAFHHTIHITSNNHPSINRIQHTQIKMALLHFVLIIASLVSLSFGKKSSKQWQKTNWDGVERELERGDDPALLESEDQVKIADMERRRAAPLEQPISAEIT